MSEEKSSTELAIERTDMASSRTRWAADRTLWAAERTFIAWLRTSISMIGFGISIGKAGGVIEQQGLIEESLFGLRMMGLIFIALAVIGLTGALIQQYRIVNRIARQGYPRVEPVPLGITMGLLVLAFGGLGAVFIFV
jgi:putative membrane protein